MTITTNAHLPQQSPFTAADDAITATMLAADHPGAVLRLRFADGDYCLADPQRGEAAIRNRPAWTLDHWPALAERQSAHTVDSNFLTQSYQSGTPREVTTPFRTISGFGRD